MPLVKRYPNRKLYDTEAKQYITLEGIAALIRQGKEVRVVDHATREDLTALVLSQIIFEQEKKQGGFLPRTVLAGLVQAGGDTLTVLQRTLASSLDLLRQVDAEIERRVRALVLKGDLTEKEGLRLLEKLVRVDGWVAGPEPTDQALEQALKRRNLVSRAELEQLSKQLDALAAKLDCVGRSKSA